MERPYPRPSPKLFCDSDVEVIKSSSELSSEQDEATLSDVNFIDDSEETNKFGTPLNLSLPKSDWTSTIEKELAEITNRTENMINSLNRIKANRKRKLTFRMDDDEVKFRITVFFVYFIFFVSGKKN